MTSVGPEMEPWSELPESGEMIEQESHTGCETVGAGRAWGLWLVQHRHEAPRVYGLAQPGPVVVRPQGSEVQVRWQKDRLNLGLTSMQSVRLS